MNWTNVKLIFFREVRDQLRDRRTLFMIAVLPVLLYPLLGTSMLQMAQFVQEQSTKVLVVGAADLPESPPLFSGKRFADDLFEDATRSGLLQVEVFGQPGEPDSPPLGDLLAQSQTALAKGQCDAVLYFPPDFGRRLGQLRERLRERGQRGSDVAVAEPPIEVPSPEAYFNSANERSHVAQARIETILARWREEIVRQNLVLGGLPESAARPFKLSDHDVADVGHRDAALWSKVLPFLLLIWALTGAFYPAVDLCAGEKERGTLETLLSSPAERSEIVWGKLLTIMLFSMATAVLNLLSMGLTGSLLLSQLPRFGPPPPLAPLWLLIALVPVSALFSALCLALAALARSSKEGQYYLMPLVLVTLPLVVLPMAPGVELNLGNSLIPITGVVLLLRAMLEGSYWQALLYAPPVIAITLVCCLMAIRWAVDQFNSESVLFRESERLDLGLWLRQLWRERGETPTAGAAVFCALLIVLAHFFLSFALPQPPSLAATVVTQIVLFGGTAVLLSLVLTRDPSRTLLLRWPALPSVSGAILSLPAAALLAVALHPIVSWLQFAVARLYPVSSEIEKAIEKLFPASTPLWQLILIVGLLPAVCEELAFRGFVLSGLRHLGHKWRAIIISSVLFGVAHGILQQSILASLLGTVLGYLAVQSGSLLPGMVYHFVHNSLFVVVGHVIGHVTDAMVADYPVLSWLLRKVGPDKYACDGPALVAGGCLAAALIFYWFHRLPHQQSPEELLQDSIREQTRMEVAATPSEAASY
jgi:sodium transport system permease protein